MRYYAITKGEMTELSTLGGLTTFFIAIGTFLAGMSWDMGLALSTASLEKTQQITLQAIQPATITGAVGCLLIALGLGIWRLVRGAAIRSETRFD